MVDREFARLLARYKTWADRLTFEAVAALPAGLEGRPHGFTARIVVPHPELEGLWPAQQQVNDWLLAWSERQSRSSLEEGVAFRLVSGEAGTMTRGEILMHIVNHATYHRGWVSDLFFQVPATPPTTDWNVFLSDCRSGPGNTGSAKPRPRVSARRAASGSARSP
ncbi:MAG: damage-inducible protein DinB [Gammaproteobacteria bacterium]|nr:MAG: damage-inducible protein DinB [Gammaproteobacteria bacterium]